MDNAAGDKGYMKSLRFIFIGLICGFVSSARAEIASASYVQSILQSLVPDVRTVNGHALSANVTVTKGDVGLSNVQNVDQTDATNITSGTVNAARLPIGTTESTVAAGNDVRFNTVTTSQPSGTPPSGQVFMWFN